METDNGGRQQAVVGELFCRWATVKLDVSGTRSGWPVNPMERGTVMRAISEPGKLIEAIAPVLGFPPRESLVLVTVVGGSLGCVLRADLADVRADGVTMMVGAQPVWAADGVVAVVVSEDQAHCAMCGEEIKAWMRELDAALQKCGTELLSVLAIDRIEAGGQWHCADGCGVSGTLGDPMASEIAAIRVASGQRLYRSRSEVKALIAVDPVRARAVASILESVESAVAGQVDVAEAVRAATSVASRLAAGAAIADAELAAVGATLTDIAVRDQLFALADTATAAAAEDLWTVLARVLPGAWRAEALALLAVSAYVRGDGVLAGVAVDAALSEAPTHRMAAMLRMSLEAGLEPDKIRQVVAQVRPAPMR